MKNLMYLFLAVLVFTACGNPAEEKEAETKTEIPAEKIELEKRPEAPVVISISRYKISPDDQEGGILSKETFSSDGLRTEFVSYDYYGSGEEEQKTVYSYDDSGNLIKVEDLMDEKTVEEFSYNENGNKLTAKWYRPYGLGASEEISYDENGSELEIKYFDENGEYDFSRVFEIVYDEKGRIISEKKWEKYTDGTSDLLQYHMTYAYNNDGLVVQEVSYREDGVEVYSKTFEYEGKNVVEEISFDDGEPETIDRNEYNEFGELIKSQTFNAPDNLQYTNIYKYDSFGNNIFMMYNHADGDAWGERTVYKYED